MKLLPDFSDLQAKKCGGGADVRRFRHLTAVVVAAVIFLSITAVVYAAEKEETALSVLSLRTDTLSEIAEYRGCGIF